MIEVKFTCADAYEFKHLLALLTAGNEEAASAYEETHAPAEPIQTVTTTILDKKQPTREEIAAVEPAENEPAQEPEQPTVSLQELQTLGRKLAAAGKGTAIQDILKRHNVKLMSKIPEAERAAVYAEMQEVQEG